VVAGMFKKTLISCIYTNQLINLRTYLVLDLLLTLTFPDLNRVLPFSLELHIQGIVQRVEVDTFMSLFEDPDVGHVFEVVAGLRVDAETALLLEGQYFSFLIKYHHFRLTCYEERSAEYNDYTGNQILPPEFLSEARDYSASPVSKQ
jgi:hypothetical protein